MTYLVLPDLPIKWHGNIGTTPFDTFEIEDYLWEGQIWYQVRISGWCSLYKDNKHRSVEDAKNYAEQYWQDFKNSKFERRELA